MSLMSEIDRIESNINDFYYSAAMNGADISSLNSDGLAYSMDSSKNQLFDFMMHRVTEINDINGDVTILSGMSNTLMRLYGFLGNQKELTSINMPALKKISNAHYLLSGDVNLKEINIPRLESTENTVFSGNLSSIQKIDFPSLTNWPLGSNRLSNEMSSLEYVSTPNVSAVTTFPFGYPKLSVIDFSDRTLNSIPTLNITSTTVNQMMEATFWENLNLSILVPESLYENWRIATNWLFFQAVPQSLSVDKQYIFPVPDKTIEIGKKDGTTVRLSATQLDSTCGQYSCPKI